LRQAQKCVGDEKLAGKGKGHARREAGMTRSIGATPRARIKDVNSVGNKESWNGTYALIKHTSVEGARYNVRRADLDRTKCANQEAI
jgi:hypothetical protein